MSELGRLDMLVNNAAHQMAHDSFLDIPAKEIEFVFRTNVIAMFHLCQAAVPVMEPGSTIIDTTSIQAAQPSPSLLHYASMKGTISSSPRAGPGALRARHSRQRRRAPGRSGRRSWR